MFLKNKSDMESWYRENSIESLKSNMFLELNDIVLVAETACFYKIVNNVTDIPLNNKLYAKIMDKKSHTHNCDEIITNDQKMFVSKSQVNTWNNKLDNTDNAFSASKLQTPVKINGISFDGTQDIEIIKEHYGKEIKYNFVLNPKTKTFTIPENFFSDERISISIYIDGIRLIENVNYTLDKALKTITLNEQYDYKVNVEIVGLDLDNMMGIKDFMLRVEDGNLVLYATDGNKCPNFSLSNGHLYIDIN